MPSGHIKGDIRRRAKAAKAAHDRSAESLEGPLEEQLRRFFADQRTSTIARFTGKRGKQMLKRAGVRAVQPPSASGGGATGPGQVPPVPPATGAVAGAAAGSTLGSGVTAAALAAGTVSVAALATALGIAQPRVAQRLGYSSTGDLAAALAAGLVTMAVLKQTFPERTAEVADTELPAAEAVPAGVSGPSGPPPPAGPIDPSAIFDQGYWNDRLEGILRPYYDAAGAQAEANVRQHLELPPGFDDGGTHGAVRQFLEARGNQTSPRINQATYEEIVRQLQAGVEAGEGQQALAKRVDQVFETADRVRARRIAQTEVQAALNGSANAYAEALPAGTVGSKRWLAHWPPTGGEDPRTRDTHRLAAGQTVPLGAPFYVGGFPMQHPGDPAAPPELTVNCRCALMFLPPGADGGNLVFAAKNIHRKAAETTGTSLSPAAAQFLAT